MGLTRICDGVLDFLKNTASWLKPQDRQNIEPSECCQGTFEQGIEPTNALR